MPPAGRQASVTIAITPVRTSSDSPRIVSPLSLGTVSAAEAAKAAETQPSLAPVDFSTAHPAAVDRCRHLTIAIRQRIELRLGGRVRELAVRVSGNTIVLEGHCATYHTKQLAQHAALGVLEDELLENAIVVTM